MGCFLRADQLKAEIEKEAVSVQKEYNRAIAMQMYAEDPDDVMAGVGRYWENYFGADKEVYHKNEKLTDLTKLLAAREFSLTTLCGNLLEHTKKGISIVYGSPNSWPPGRKIGSQSLSKVILEARNQSTHNDEAIKNGSYKKADVTTCFNTLKQEIDPVFADFISRDMSFDVIKTLGWRAYDNYKNDVGTIK
ncbi:MAG: hypothetical protein ICV83_01925 [Cytophagales bacterium]|nr:hypothetical protein [Cytophagales bacterium]